MPSKPSSEASSERADARRNRELLIGAAREAIAEKGLDVSSLEIAERAGLGVGTLYRRFTTKEALLEAVLLDLLAELAEEARAATDDPDPWTGLQRFLTAMTRAQRTNHGLSELIGAEHDPVTARATADLRHALAGLVDRARDAGAIRDDVTVGDVAFLAKATLVGDRCIGIAASPDQPERCLAVMLDGLRPPGATALPGRAPRSR